MGGDLHAANGRVAVHAQPGSWPVLGAGEEPAGHRHPHRARGGARLQLAHRLQLRRRSPAQRGSDRRQCRTRPSSRPANSWWRGSSRRPFGSKIQHYKVIDAALGVIERGTWKVADAVDEQPWLPNGPIPLKVTWTRRPRDDEPARGAGMSTAVVVGSGPNGLAAAVALAKEGVEVTVLEAADEIGGGARSSEAIVPGLLHDHCSAIHPMAVGSQFLNGLELDRYGLQWRWPEIDCVHPLDGGDAGVLHRSRRRHRRRARRATARGGGGYSATPSARFDALSEDIMGPLLRVPNHPLALARFGLPTVLPASALARFFRTERARALFGGVAAHTFQAAPLSDDIGDRARHHHRRPPARLAGRGGWLAVDHQRADVAARRSRRQDRDRCAHRFGVAAAAGRCDHVRSGPNCDRRHPRRSAAGAEYPRASVAFGTGRVPSRSTSQSRAGCRGPIADAHKAGTVHLGGDFAEIAATERDIHAGRMPERPFVLVGQQYLADPQRSVGRYPPGVVVCPCAAWLSG